MGGGFDAARASIAADGPAAALVLEADPPVEAARGVDVQHPHRSRALVAKGVLGARRHEHERSGWCRHVPALDGEDHLALEDVEGVVLLLVDVGSSSRPAAISMIEKLKRGVSTVRARNSTLPM